MKKYFTMSIHKIIIFLLVNLLPVLCDPAKECKPKIAVVGGGIGGASAAHFLTALFENNSNIHLYEANKIGGRLATVRINDHEYEAGGAVIHSRNRLMKYFLKYLGLEARPSGTSELYGIWNGDEFVFKESDYEIATLAKLFYRYGLEPYYLHKYVNSILDDFEKIYELHDEGRGFSNVTSLLAAMNRNFPDLLKVSIRDHLKEKGYSTRLIEELVKATLVVNYGQETDVQSFVGSVSVAGAGYSLWSVKGGNKRVVEELIKRNELVKVRPCVVESIEYNAEQIEEISVTKTSQYSVKCRERETSEVHRDTYDIVIIATPLTNDQQWSIKFENFPNTENFKFPGNYQTTYATFLEGTLNVSHFGLDEPIQGVLSCAPEKTIISSAGKLSSVTGEDSNVWKIFTRDPLQLELIEKMFLDLNKNIGAVTHEWKAYPKYSTNEQIGNFKLYNGLYHVNAIEWAASAMEMSAIGGRNVAILAHKDFTGRYKLATQFGAQRRKLQSKKVEL